MCLPAAAPRLCPPPSRVSAFCRSVPLAAVVPCVCPLPPRASARCRPAPLPAAAPRLCPLPPRASARRRLVSLAAAVPCLCLPPPCVFAAFAPRLCPLPLRVSARCRPAPLPAAALCLCCRRPAPLPVAVRTLHASPQCAKINTAVFSVRSAAQPSVSGAGAAAGWFANGPSDRPAAGNPRTQVLLAGHARAGRFGLAPRKGLSFPYFSHRKEGIL